MSNPNDRNQAVIASFRATGGKVEGAMALILLTTTGAKSGKPFTTPLAYTQDGDRVIVVASKGGAPTNPDWYHNLVANPLVTVEQGTESYQARATIAVGAERDRLYDKIATELPFFAEYQRKTTRQIPVVILERVHP